MLTLLSSGPGGPPYNPLPVLGSDAILSLIAGSVISMICWALEECAKQNE